MMKLQKVIFFVILISYNAIPARACNPLLSSILNVSKGLNEILGRDEGNLVYSPISIHAVLTLLYEAAAGDTAKSLKKAVPYVKGQCYSLYKCYRQVHMTDAYGILLIMMRSKYKLSVNFTNKVFVSDKLKLKSNFKKLVKTFAIFKTINFSKKRATAKLINDMVSEGMPKKITDFVSPKDLADPSRLIIADAYSVRFDWLCYFNASLTKKEKFYLPGTDTKECEMMHANAEFEYVEPRDLGAQVLKLPYDNGFNTFIFLPKSKDGTKDLVEKLQTNNFSEIIGNLEWANIRLSLPKFKIQTKIDWKKTLIKLGLGGIFKKSANFSNMLASKKRIRIGKVVQTTFININEFTGSAATRTGATGAQVKSRSALEAPPIVFNANHPFIFAITYCPNQDKTTNTIPVFIGKLAEP